MSRNTIVALGFQCSAWISANLLSALRNNISDNRWGIGICPIVILVARQKKPGVGITTSAAWWLQQHPPYSGEVKVTCEGRRTGFCFFGEKEKTALLSATRMSLLSRLSSTSPLIGTWDEIRAMLKYTYSNLHAHLIYRVIWTRPRYISNETTQRDQQASSQIKVAGNSSCWTEQPTSRQEKPHISTTTYLLTTMIFPGRVAVSRNLIQKLLSRKIQV